MSLNAIIDYYASFFHALKQRSDRFSYGIIPFYAYFVVFKTEGFSFQQNKNNYYKRHSFNICCVDVKNRRKWWKIFNNRMSSFRIILNMSRRAEIVNFFSPIFISVSFLNLFEANRSTDIHNTLLNIHINSFPFQTMACDRFYLFFFLPFIVNFPLLFFSLWENSFLYPKCWVKAFFLFNIDYVFLYFKFKRNTLKLFSFGLMKKKTFNWRQTGKNPAQQKNRIS